jgi:hypothetical protein
MTSLGLLQYSEINEISSINSNNLTEIEKKRQARHNITIKKRNPFLGNSNSSNSNSSNLTEGGNGYYGGASNTVENMTDNSDNVQNMLKLINNTNGYDETDDNGGLTDFNPPPRAEVSSKNPSPTPTLKPTATRQPDTRQPDIDYEKPNKVMQQMAESMNPVDDPATAVKPRKYPMPLDSQEGFNSLPKTYASDYYKQYVPYFNQPGSQTVSNVNNRDQLLEKLNYMIHLLEEQKDEKTGHVMEEVILYSFLGVFIIFIVDSFARAGKYTR